MSNKGKSISLSKKSTSSLPMKEIFQQNTLTTEILRLILARSDDISILKAISDRKTGKLRLQSAFAEKTLQEIECKEEWRLAREENILTLLVNAKLEAPLHKKQFEKLVKKMLKVNSQFDDDPTENDMSLSEIHIQKIMNIKIGPENTIITYNEKGQACATVPSAVISPSIWKESICQPVKLLEAFTSGDLLSLYPAIYFCVKHSRTNYTVEVSRQRQAIEEGSNFLSPNIAVIITSKKSKNLIPSGKKSVSPAGKVTVLPEPDYMVPLSKMFMGMNAELEKSIRHFVVSYFERNGEEKNRTAKTRNLVEKAMRLRNYEKYSAVSPWANNRANYPLNTVRTMTHLQIMPQILFDLENPYFDEGKSFADRIKTIHSCIVIQNYFMMKKKKVLVKNVLCIQKHFRGYLGRKMALRVKTTGLRKMYCWERLKHWYPLLVNKLRENRSVVPINEDYSCKLEKIIFIQSVIRGVLTRKIQIFWKREFYKIRSLKAEASYYLKKQKLWVASQGNDELAFCYSKSSEEDMSSFIEQNEARARKKEEKSISEILRLKEKAEVEVRNKFLENSKKDRIKALE